MHVFACKPEMLLERALARVLSSDASTTSTAQAVGPSPVCLCHRQPAALAVGLHLLLKVSLRLGRLEG